MTDAQFISAIIAAYALTASDITDLASEITSARLTSCQASYRRAQRVVGLKPNWKPTAALQKHIEHQAREDAQSIAETYKGLLKSFVEQFLKIKKGWRDLYDNIAQAISDVVDNVSEWMSSFLPWKSKQVANYTGGSGLNDGIDAFILDWENGDIIDTETGEVIDMGDYAIAVYPDEASNDICREYAGKTFDISENDTIIEFPAHGGCPHYKEVIRV